MAVKPRIKLDKKEAKKGDLVEVKALVSHVMETGLRKDADGNIDPAQDPQQVRLHGRRQAGVRRRFRDGGLGQPVHPVQVQGRGIRPGRADLDRRRRLDDRRRRDSITVLMPLGAIRRSDAMRIRFGSARRACGGANDLQARISPGRGGDGGDRARRLDARLRAAAPDAGPSCCDFEPLGNVTLVHLTDLHAQLMPVLFPRAVGQSRRRRRARAGAAYHRPGVSRPATRSRPAPPPPMRSPRRISPRSPKATAGSAASTASRPCSRRSAPSAADRIVFLDGGDTWQNSYTSLVSKGQDMVDCMALLKPDAMTGHWEFTLGAERVKEIVETARLSVPRAERPRHRMERSRRSSRWPCSSAAASRSR